MPACIRNGALTCGGVLGYPLDQLREEVAFIAYHFHWPHDEVMHLEHAERRLWVEEIADINRKLAEMAQNL